jgi:hypothetical protein
MILDEETTLLNIPLVVVDRHHEVFKHWYNKFSNDKLVLLHIDAHHDLFTHAPVFDGNVKDYEKKLTIGNFILPAMHKGFISTTYWVDPQKNYLDISYLKNPVFSLKNGLILEENYDIFRDNLPKASKHDLKNELNNKKPFILDIDLDAFDLIGENASEYDVNEKIFEVISLIKELKKPSYISISRSQNPNFVNPKKVDNLQEKILNELYKIYKL